MANLDQAIHGGLGGVATELSGTANQQHKKRPQPFDGRGHLLEGNKIEIRRSSATVATSREGHHQLRSGPAVLHQRWGRERG